MANRLPSGGNPEKTLVRLLYFIENQCLQHSLTDLGYSLMPFMVRSSTFEKLKKCTTIHP
jgi:hypothetical protein